VQSPDSANSCRSWERRPAATDPQAADRARPIPVAERLEHQARCNCEGQQAWVGMLFTTLVTILVTKVTILVTGIVTDVGILVTVTGMLVIVVAAVRTVLVTGRGTVATGIVIVNLTIGLRVGIEPRSLDRIQLRSVAHQVTSPSTCPTSSLISSGILSRRSWACARQAAAVAMQRSRASRRSSLEAWP
jgi:hypothetical protein